MIGNGVSPSTGCTRSRATARPSTASTSSSTIRTSKERPAVLQPRQHVPHRGRRHPQHQRPGARCGHLAAHRARCDRRRRRKNIFDVEIQPDRDDPGVQHPELPRVDAPRHGVHPDRLRTSSPSTRASSGPLTVFEITPDGDGGIKVKESTAPARWKRHPRSVDRRRRSSSSPAAAATVSRPSASSGTTARTRCASLRAPSWCTSATT